MGFYASSRALSQVSIGVVIPTARAADVSQVLTQRAVDHLEFSTPSLWLGENSRTEPTVLFKARWYHTSLRLSR
ncbi:hypothetical protein Mnod_4603 [Methylobacterium nodulans ORS 2060]|uniref:Uncharacterized protein n=1 Tax=Methylobacterium nodulans (strain LMG 21967 / CNCM I-2342 / ORS 2060) TaxID=460265 RepID=B8ID78_METNO|nr:hypothetical protein Mnod_4603 [Methylobacterium nodulans ORS 2060]